MKPNFRRAQKDLFTQRNIFAAVGQFFDIGPEDFPDLLKSSLESINIVETNKRAWKRDGMIPFNEEVFWDALEKELRIEALQLNSTPSGDQPSCSLQGLQTSPDGVNEGFRVDVGVGINVDVPNPTGPRRVALAKAIR